jgi:O-antigen/teichoic acid export membrane protein
LSEGGTAQPRRVSSVAPVLIATAFAGVASYAVTWLVPRQIGLAHYAVFAVAWSGVYLIVGALSGIQQEVTRGTTRVSVPDASGKNRARNFAVVASLLVFVLIVASAPFWVGSVFPTERWALVWPLALGTAVYAVVAVVAGSLSGLGEWRAVSLFVGTDALLRLVAIGVALVFTQNVVVLAWAIVLPFPVAVLVLWPYLRKRLIGHSQLDVGYRSLAWNVSRTIVAAASTAIMVSGFPLLLGVTSPGESKSLVGLFILTITLTRAPLIVVVMSIQGYLIVVFRDAGEHFWARFLRVLALVAAGGIVLALACWLLGPLVFHLLFPASATPGGPFVGALVLSSALVGALFVSATAVLARGKHVFYTTGWVLAALVTIGSLLLPFDFTTRTLVALFAGPAVGLLVQASYLAVAGRREGRAGAPT